MKKQILELLKTKYEGVNESILDRIADKLAKTAKTDEDATTVVEGVTFQQILESYGDSRANEAQKTAVSNYEKKHGLKDGKHIEIDAKETPKKDDAADEVPAWAKTLIESNKALSQRLETIEGDKTTATRKSVLTKILNAAPETIRTRYEKDFARMNFADDDDFNAWIGEITPDVEKITTDFNVKGAVVGRPKAGGGNSSSGETNPHLKARIAEKEAAKSAPAIIGLTTTESK